MTIETWLLFVLVAIVPAISPGPAIFLAVSNVLQFGRSATLISAAANALGLVIVGLATSLGLGAVMAASAFAFTLLKIAGAVYLIWLGIKSWRDKSHFVEKQENGNGPRGQRLFFSALFVSLTNPKAIILIAALFPPFITQNGSFIQQALILSLTYAFLCFANHVLIAQLGGRMRQYFSDFRRLIIMRRTLGVVFISFGAALAAARR